MPRFIGKPVIIEAHQYTGGPLPLNFQIAVVRRERDGAVTVATGDGLRQCNYRDWIARGADGGFFVVRDALFEANYEPMETGETAERTKRPYVRRNLQDA